MSTPATPRPAARGAAVPCLGWAARVVADLERLTAEQPLREEGWRLLALALYQSGRQADALAVLRRVRELLAAELGVDPGPALRGLERDILAQQPSLTLTAAADGPGMPAGEVPVNRGPFVGRDAELALVRVTGR